MAIKTFLRKFILFIALPMLVILVMDIILRVENTLYKEKYKGAIKASDSIEILVLGTSHATYGVDPEAFNMYTFNVANLAQSIYFDKRITLSLLSKMKNLKYVLINVGYHSYSFSSQFNRDYWSYYGNGIKYEGTSYFSANLSPTLFGYTPKVAYTMIKRKITNRLKHGSDIINFDVQEGVDLFKPIVKGFIALDGRDTLNFNHDAYSFMSEHYTEIVDSSDEKNMIINDLEDFIKILQSRGITPILVTPPTYTEYNKYLNPTYIEENNRINNYIANKYNIEYWDFLNSELFSIEDYHDMEHLNRKGAHKFSAMLNDSIIKMEEEHIWASN